MLVIHVASGISQVYCTHAAAMEVVVVAFRLMRVGYNVKRQKILLNACFLRSYLNLNQ